MTLLSLPKKWIRNVAVVSLVAALVVFVAGGASGATLDVVGGQLHGAFGVDVGGSLYDVEFLDGTCRDLFTGCDEASDFAFTDESSALLAAQALLDQVFLDGPSGSFDTESYLTNGCGHWELCAALTPYSLSFATVAVVATYNRGWSFSASDGLFLHNHSPNYYPAPPPDISSGEDDSTFARWTPVPEPSTSALLALGITGIAARQRHHRRGTTRRV